MTTLNDEVRSVVEGFVNSGELFTALDVSNKVKLVFPLARHREIRDEVRALYGSTISSAGWARTPINVTLADGSSTEALLYHPLTDSWDLDNKYDAQKRAQGTVNAVPQTVATPVNVAPVVVSAPVVPAKVLPMRDQWAQLFNTQASLFPLK